MATTTTSNRAVITYEDGRVETVNYGKPAVIYDVSQIGIDGTEDAMMFAYVASWIAAGRPGLDGEELTREAALKHMRAWLDGVDEIDWESTPVPGPPTKQPARKRGSRA